MSAIDKWQADWCFKRYSVSIEFSSQQRSQVELDFFCSNKDIFAVQNTPTNWKLLLFNSYTNQVPDDQFVAAIVEAAKLELFNAVYVAITNKPSKLEPISKQESFFSPFQSIHKIDSGLIRIDIKFEVQSICLYLPAAIFCDTVLGCRKKSAQKLEKISVKELTASISANVNLSLGSHLLSDVNSLEVGDILVSNVSIQTLFNVSIGEKKIAEAHLGQKGVKKATLLVNRKHYE